MSSVLAILGLGRTGLAVARGAGRLGFVPVVVDESPLDRLSKPELIQQARSEGIDVRLGSTESLLALKPAVVVTNPAVRRDHPKLLECVAAGIPVWSEVEFAYRISKAPIVAITGTNGKSTTTVMTYLCLQAAGVDAVLCGNIYGSGYPEVPLTEAALNSTEDQILVAEISSFQLEWIDTFKPVAAAITNITPDHLDRYGGSFEEYAKTKCRIFENMDDRGYRVEAPPPPCGSSWERGLGVRVLRVGSDARADTTFHILEREFPLGELPFRESHNLSNACTAALLAYGALAATNRNADPERIFHGLTGFRGLAHRMEVLGERRGIKLINNSMCTNPAAVVTSAQSLDRPAHLLIGGTNKDLDFNPLRNYLQQSPHSAYLFGSDAVELRKMLGHSLPTFDTMKEAFDAAARAAKDGDVVMLAPGCASTDQFRDFRDRGDVFKAIAKDWLENESDT